MTKGRPGTALGALYSDTAPGAALDGKVSGWAELAQAAHGPGEARTRLRSLQNAMAERVPSGGGYLVPEVMRSDMVYASLEAAIIRPLATVIPTSTLRTGLPTIDDTSHVGGSVLGGMTWTWTEEGQQVTPAPLSPPAAPALSPAASGGTVANGTYQAVITYVNAAGETTASASASVTTTGTGISTITVTSPASSGNATGWYAYVTQAGGNTYTRQQAAGSPTLIGTSLLISAPPTSSGTNPPAGNTTGVLSAPSYARLVMEAKKLATYLGGVPNELLDDGPAFEAYCRVVIPMGLAWAEDQAFIAGSGSGQPQGILNAPCAVNVTRTTSLQADVASMVTRMLPASMRNFIWLCSPDKISALLNLYTAIGTPANVATAPSAWLQGSPADGWTLLGRPLYPTEHVPASGTRGDLIAVDPKWYVIADRQAMTIDTSPLGTGFPLTETEYRIISRLDGRVWLQQPLTPQNGSATVSPVVILN